MGWKGLREAVPEGALAVQEAIIKVIKDRRPEDAVLAEEGPEDEPVDVNAEHLWIVDPICGSLNYGQGIPIFGVSVALRSQGNIRVGVVFDPCRNELFEATIDGPARLNGEVITVQQIAEGREAYEHSWIGLDLPADGERRLESLEVFQVIADEIFSISVLGSPALGLCYVAAGRLHAYVHLDAKLWDIAAANLILRRAGGTFTDAEGASWLHSDGGYIASNAIIHGWTLRSVQRVRHRRLSAGSESATEQAMPTIAANQVMPTISANPTLR